MFKNEIYTVKSPYREDMVIRGYSFGKGEPAACILGSERGNEVQQMYICSQLVKVLKELEAKGCINANKKILVIPVINALGMNVNRRFFGVENQDINRMFPGKEYGDTTDRIADGIFKVIREYSYGIQLTSFYMSGEFVPHVRMMETGYQNTSLANLFGLPFVVVRKPTPLDTKTLNYNWQDEMTAAFSVYTNKNDMIDDKSARQAVAAVLRFLTRMGIIRYESHSGYISHVIMEKDLTDVHTMSGGIFKGMVHPGEDVRYGHILAEIIDPYEGFVKETVVAPTDGIVFFAHTEPLITEGDIAYRLIHRLHE
ncbi:MAG: M14 family metallopeptidase [Suilimivivens sp.]